MMTKKLAILMISGILGATTMIAYLEIKQYREERNKRSEKDEEKADMIAEIMAIKEAERIIQKRMLQGQYDNKTEEDVMAEFDIVMKFQKIIYRMND